MLHLELILLTCCIVFIVDLSGISNTIKKMLWLWLKPNKQYQDFNVKLITCSLCLTHHILLLYIIFLGEFCITNYFIICLLSFATPIIKDTLVLIKDILVKIIDTLYFLINKI